MYGAIVSAGGVRIGRRRLFVPKDMPGCVGWWRADTGITIGTGVSQWADLTGLGHHFVNAVGATQPTLIASAVNGRPAVRGDGLTQYLRASFAYSGVMTIIFAFKSITVGAPATQVNMGGASNNLTDIFVANENVPNLRALIGGVGQVIYNAAVANGAYDIATISNDNTNNTLRTGGVLRSTNAGTGGTYGGITLFASSLTVPTRNTNMEYAEVAAYKRALSATEIQRVERYMGRLYNVAVA